MYLYGITFLILYSTLLRFSVAALENVNSDLLPGRDVCGKQQEQRISSDEECGIGEHPWLVNLENRYHEITCGGVLISNRYVLTAAHCIQDPIFNPIESVRLGEHNLQTKKDCEDELGFDSCADQPKSIKIKERIMHKNYNKDDENRFHDIALLRLSERVIFTAFIRPICLPLSTKLRQTSMVESIAVVAGWGMVEKKWKSEVKVKAEILILKNDDCEEIFKEEGGTIAASQICAGGKYRSDACSGDSGGPLMYRERSEQQINWIAIGIVSYGSEICESEDKPGVYTRVTEYLDWITSNIKP